MSQDTNDRKSSAAFRFGRKFRDTVASARSAAAGTIRDVADRAARKIAGPRESYQGVTAPIEFQFDVSGETIWATQQQIADLFGVERSVITKHIQNVLSDSELDGGPATCAKIAQVRSEGGRRVAREVEHYSLDMILAVGYRVSSRQAPEFRRWATSKLSAFVRDGYVLNEGRLQNDPIAVESLAERVRSIRYSEKHLYQRVRDCVTAIASDYDGSAEHVRIFFARMQDKFHWAACEQTAQDLLLSRADGSKERMGMTTQLNARPTLKDAEVAKNYLSEHELKLQMVAGDAFFAYVENMMLRNKSLTTAQLLAKIDEVFKFNEMPVFP